MAHDSEDGMELRPKIALVATLVAAILFADLATKALAQRLLEGQPTIHLLGDTVRIGYVLNTGVFLSLGHDLTPGLRFWLFVVGVGGILAMLLVLAFKDPRFRKSEVIAVAAIVGGGLGNLWDRIGSGAVRDFMNVGIGPVRTGIFNVADMAITFGGIALLLLPLLRRKSRSGS